MAAVSEKYENIKEITQGRNFLFFSPQMWPTRGSEFTKFWRKLHTVDRFMLAFPEDEFWWALKNIGIHHKVHTQPRVSTSIVWWECSSIPKGSESDGAVTSELVTLLIMSRYDSFDLPWIFLLIFQQTIWTSFKCFIQYYYMFTESLNTGFDLFLIGFF